MTSCDMAGRRAGVLTSVLLLAACGGKHGDDTTQVASEGGGTGGIQATTGAGGPVQTDSGDLLGTGGTASGAGGGAGSTPPAIDAGADSTDGPDPDPLLDDVANLQSDFGYVWKDSWFIAECYQKSGYACLPRAACRNLNAPDLEDRGSVANETFPLGGELGKTYAVSFKFNGIAEGKYYDGGSWAQPNLDIATPGGPEPAIDETGIANDTFYIGGTSIFSNYSVMRMRVLDANKKEIARYYMNAYPGKSGAESHRTFLLSYAHTIDVPGRGFIEYHLSDADCHSIDNCGPGNVTDACDAARYIPNEPNVTLPPVYTEVAMQKQPYLVPLASLNTVTGAKQPWHAQISHVTITKIVAH
jgi:hypothetical protein